MNIPSEIHVYFHVDIKFPTKVSFEYIEGMNVKEEKEVTNEIKDLDKAAS